MRRAKQRGGARLGFCDDPFRGKQVVKLGQLGQVVLKDSLAERGEDGGRGSRAAAVPREVEGCHVSITGARAEGGQEGVRAALRPAAATAARTLAVAVAGAGAGACLLSLSLPITQATAAARCTSCGLFCGVGKHVPGA